MLGVGGLAQERPTSPGRPALNPQPPNLAKGLGKYPGLRAHGQMPNKQTKSLFGPSLVIHRKLAQKPPGERFRVQRSQGRRSPPREPGLAACLAQGEAPHTSRAAHPDVATSEAAFRLCPPARCGAGRACVRLQVRTSPSAGRPPLTSS